MAYIYTLDLEKHKDKIYLSEKEINRLSENAIITNSAEHILWLDSLLYMVETNNADDFMYIISYLQEIHNLKNLKI